MSGPRRARLCAAFVLLTAGVCALGYVAVTLAHTRAYQAAESRRFEAERAAPQAAVAPAPIEGGTIGQMQIRRLDFAAVVVQGDSPGILRRAVGHVASTALPGDPGNVVLAGHRDTFFRPLEQVVVGDTITLRTRTGDFEYVVDSTAVVPPSRVDVLQPTAERTLTLITCFPFAYVGPAPNRFIVRARETSGPR